MDNVSLYHALSNCLTLFFLRGFIPEIGQRDTLYLSLKQQTKLILIIIGV